MTWGQRWLLIAGLWIIGCGDSSSAQPAASPDGSSASGGSAADARMSGPDGSPPGMVGSGGCFGPACTSNGGARGGGGGGGMREPDAACNAEPVCDPEWQCGTAKDACGKEYSCGSCDGGACRGHTCIEKCDGCVVAGQCYEAGEADPNSPCRRCDPSKDAANFTAVADDTSCDDGNACTTADHCQAGHCAGTAKSCDDGVACNGIEACNPMSGSCVAGQGMCASGVCDVMRGVCAQTCTGCTVNGVCYPDGAKSPETPCLVCDVSRSTTSFSPNEGAACDGDVNPCLLSGKCDASGACVQAKAASGTACGEAGGLCKLADQCDGAGHCTQGSFRAVGETCSPHARCGGDATNPICACDAGYEGGPSACTDVDECARNTDGCDDAPDACVNEPGTFHCACPAGFTGNGTGPTGCSCSRDDYSPGCTPWTDISAQNLHACGIAGGALFCWGLNDNGQLGTGDKAPQLYPTRIGTASDWTRVVAGYHHTCGIRAGALYCWGDNALGALGNPASGLTPSSVDANSDWTDVALGLSATCGVRGGALYCWGWNGHGQVGVGKTDVSFSTPQLVASLTGVSNVSMVQTNVCAVASHQLYCWGGNTFGQVGDGTGNDHLAPFRVTNDTDWEESFNGGADACGIRGGVMYCWGIAHSAVLAETSRSDWVAVAVGSSFKCGLTRTGAGYCWGLANQGQTASGSPATVPATTPFQLTGTFSKLAADSATGFGIRDGGLVAWGSNESGVRGRTPTLVRVGAETDWADVSTALDGGCAIRGAGTLYCWGYALGATPSIDPVQIGSGTDWTRVSAGWTHICGLEAGTIQCWGKNDQGQLGDGTTTDHPAPAQVGTRTDWIDVAVSRDADGHTCAIHSDGTLYCWGANNYGQLGDGTTTPHPSPTQVPGTNWTRVWAGNDYTCGLRGGGLYCWGSASSGVLGNAANSGSQTTPLRVGTSVSWTAAGLGFSHTCATDGGALYCWGSSSFGQAAFSGSTPFVRGVTLIDNARSYSDLSATGFSTCAVSGSELYCWGRNNMGQLAAGDFVDRGAVTKANAGSGWSRVSVDTGHGCGIRSGSLYCWGDNTYGGLGSAEGFVPANVESFGPSN